MIDYATNPDEDRRPHDATAALAKLRQIRQVSQPETSQSIAPPPVQPPAVPDVPPGPEFAESRSAVVEDDLARVPRIVGETTKRAVWILIFARDTYVGTDLETHLRDAIVNKQVRLILFCGNAGDGKTAMIQHLLNSPGRKPRESRDRAWKEKLLNGWTVEQ